MKKLTDEQLAKHDDISDRLKAAAENIDEMVSNINAKIMDDLGALITKFNEIAAEANEFAVSIVKQQEDYIEGKSEAWGESDEGSNYATWKDEWESAEILNSYRLQEIEMPIDPDMVENFSNLESEPD